MKRKPFNPNLITSSPGPTHVRQAETISVSELTSRIKRAIATTLPNTVRVMGEISNFKRHSSGHLYFTLKDHACELSCVMWRSDAVKLKFEPQDGLEAVATGHIEVFEKAGRYQLYARKLLPEGLGELELAFRQLYNKLNKEGLFNNEHKKTLPSFPQRIVIITSPTGAAVGDIIRTMQRRFPCGHLLIYPVHVQGDFAPKEIASAIRRVNDQANQLGHVDLIIVGRGGGSAEDLWAFNEEIVARAIFASHIPIISAVGHEVDISIADLVADVRAATPTAAAELAVPVLNDLIEVMTRYEARLQRSTRQLTLLATSRLHGLAQHHCFRKPLHVIFQRQQWLDEICTSQQQRLTQQLRILRMNVDSYEPTIQLINPHATIRHHETRLHNLLHRLDKITFSRRQQHDHTLNELLQILRQQTLNLKLNHAQLLRYRTMLNSILNRRMTSMRESINQQQQLLNALSHKRVLHRGFSITRIKKGNKILRNTSQLADAQRIITELADGEIESEVVNLSQLELFE